MTTIGFGGSCHWCTEAIFQSLRGVLEVQQGWISSEGTADFFSEAVIVNFDPKIISEATLIAVHLHTHSCTSNHSMRTKYRSAVYVFCEEQAMATRQAIRNLQKEFESPIITEVLPFRKFTLNREDYLNYYRRNPEKPFCRNFINPKLKLLMERFGGEVIKEMHGIGGERIGGFTATDTAEKNPISNH